MYPSCSVKASFNVSGESLLMGNCKSLRTLVIKCYFTGGDVSNFQVNNNLESILGELLLTATLVHGTLKQVVSDLKNSRTKDPAK